MNHSPGISASLSPSCFLSHCSFSRRNGASRRSGLQEKHGVRRDFHRCVVLFVGQQKHGAEGRFGYQFLSKFLVTIAYHIFCWISISAILMFFFIYFTPPTAHRFVLPFGLCPLKICRLARFVCFVANALNPSNSPCQTSQNTYRNRK